MKTVVTFLFVLLSTFTLSAQIKFDENFIAKLNDYIIHRDSDKHSIRQIEKQTGEKWIYALYVYDLLTNELVVDNVSPASEYPNIPTSRKYGIYAFATVMAKADVVFINGNKYTIIDLRCPYTDVIQSVIDYFNTNSDIDHRLQPVYIQRITLQYLWNQRSYDSRGEWRDWFDNAPQDSIAHKYREFLYLGSDRENR